jgi:hypothetical protein
MRLAKIIGDSLDHRAADLVERIHLRLGFLVPLGDLYASVVKFLPAAVAARERNCRRLADMTDTERVDEPLQRYLAPRINRLIEVTDRRFAIAFDLHQVDLLVTRRKREDFRGLLHPALLIEQLDLLLAQPLDVEGAA